MTDADTDEYLALRREALLDAPLAFTSSPEDDSAPQFRPGPESMILGAFAERLVGAVGLVRDRHRKRSHIVTLWGMYVSASHRGQGAGARILEAAAEHARSMPGVSWLQLSVSSAAPAAQRLYERAGFFEWGEEPDALRFDGQSVTEHHMALRLDG